MQEDVAGIEAHANPFAVLLDEITNIDEAHPDGSCTGELQAQHKPPPLVHTSGLELFMEAPLDFPMSCHENDLAEGDANHCIQFKGRLDIHGSEQFVAKLTSAINTGGPSISPATLTADNRTFQSHKRALQAAGEESGSLPAEQSRVRMRNARGELQTHMKKLEKDVSICP